MEVFWRHFERQHVHQIDLMASGYLDEHFQFAGGEDLWVYVNKILVLHIVAQNTEQTNTVCKTFQLKNSTGKCRFSQ